MNTVFIFNGAFAQFPSAVFTTKEKAENWIKTNNLSGTLTEMPLDISTYDHAIQNGMFKPKKPHELAPKFIAGFSSRLWHDHYGEEFGKEE
jgi:hypothetical protein